MQLDHINRLFRMRRISFGFFVLFLAGTSNGSNLSEYILELQDLGKAKTMDLHLKRFLTCSETIQKVSLTPGMSLNFVSPGFPEKYPNNAICRWKFKATDNSCKLSVSCSKFNLENKRCRNDKLIFMERGETTRFCGNKFHGFTSNTSTVKVVFRSNNQVTGHGFQCTVAPVGCQSSTEVSKSTTPAPQKACFCGKANRIKIVGGTETKSNEYPWQCALTYRGTPEVFCGAALLDNMHVLTAAHCVEAIVNHKIDYEILCGAHTLSRPSSTQIVLQPDGFIQHPNYNSDNLDNDIAIIEFKVAIDFWKTAARPVCLPTVSPDNYSGIVATVTGWGTLSHNGPTPDSLQEVDVPVMTSEQCKDSYGNAITDNMICAGISAGGKDSCEGDSGGPLVYNKGDSFVLIGLVSWGYGCGYPNYPGVYTKVANFLPWINTHTTSGTKCTQSKTY